MSSRVTIPAVSPCSLVTIAIWYGVSGSPEELLNFLILRDKMCRTNETTKINFVFVRKAGKNPWGVDDSYDFIDRTMVDRDTRISLDDDSIEMFIKIFINIDCIDTASRYVDLPHCSIIEFKYVLYELIVWFCDSTTFFWLCEEELDFFFAMYISVCFSFEPHHPHNTLSQCIKEPYKWEKYFWNAIRGRLIQAVTRSGHFMAMSFGICSQKTICINVIKECYTKSDSMNNSRRDRCQKFLENELSIVRYSVHRPNQVRGLLLWCRAVYQRGMYPDEKDWFSAYRPFFSLLDFEFELGKSYFYKRKFTLPQKRIERDKGKSREEPCDDSETGVRRHIDVL